MLALAILAGLVLGLLASRATDAQAPQPNSDETKLLAPPVAPPPPPMVVEQPKPKVIPKVTTKTPLVASKKISPATLTTWLEKHNSPLSIYSEQLLTSDYWSLIIGICYIEQYHCSHAPGNNYWGMMKSGGGLRVFASLPEAITYMDGYFVKLSTKRSTVESLRGYYCASACTNWEPTVKRIKAELEALE